MEWLSIETAPKRKNVLLFNGKRVLIGHWSAANDATAEISAKYGWPTDLWIYEGRTSTQSAKTQPTHWMPLPGFPNV